MLSSRTLTTSFEGRSLIGPELSNRLCWLGAPDILQCPSSQHWISSVHLQHFTSNLGLSPRSSCLIGKCFSKWTISSAHLFFIFVLYQKPNAVAFKTTIELINIHLCWKKIEGWGVENYNRNSLPFSCLEHIEVNYLEQSHRWSSGTRKKPWLNET